MNANEMAAESRRLMKEAQANADPSILSKAYTQSATATSGLTAYDLEAPAKLLFPVITPLRNALPRVSGKGGIQAAWRAVTAINSGTVMPGISGGNRGAVTADTVTDYTAAYKGLGLEQNVTFEADYAGENFEDVKALAVENLLKSMMIAEEKMILGGNCSMALALPVVTLTANNTGGGMVNNAVYTVAVAALTFEGYMVSSMTGGLVQSYTRTNADASTDTINGGCSQMSANATANAGTIGTNLGSISATCAAVAGAVGYAWFWANAGTSPTLGAITTINSVLITSNVGTGTAVSPGVATLAGIVAANYSTNALDFDGLLTFAMNASLNSYQGTQATGTAGTGTPLTADGNGGIVEIDAALQRFWDQYRLSPDEIWVSAQEQRNISAKVLMGASNATSRFVFNADQGMIAGGTMVRSYLNKFSMDGAKEIPIRIHPNMPPGTIFFNTKSLPYPMSNVTNVAQMRLRRDYYQIEWPLRSRKYEYGVYMDGVLQHYFPPAIGVIKNIGNG